MIEDLLIEFDEMGFAPTTPCSDSEKYAIEWREKVRTEFEHLEAENAELKARLEKAVELPRIIHPNSYEWHIQYQYESGIISCDIRYSETEAEARLAELKKTYNQ